VARTNVADVLADGLARAGAGRIFVAPAGGAGASDAPITTLRQAAARRGLPALDAPDITLAAVMAAVSGEVGDGPGALLAGLTDARGLVRGLAHAQRDRAPLVAITEAGADAALLAPVVKASLVVAPASAGHWIAHAANLAASAPRGPVHLVVDAAVASEPALAVAAACRPAPLPAPDPLALDALGATLATAQRPILITGLECGPDDAKWLRAFAETLPAPVLATAKGRGVLADPHPLALGVLTAAHPLLARADVIVLVGVDASELSPGVLPPATPVARIGRAAWNGPTLATDVLGDIALLIEEMAPRVRARPAADWDVAELDRLKRAQTQALRSTPPARLLALAREAMPAGAIATGDVPALAAWQAVAPRETLSALGMATPGYAVTAAVAAQLAHSDRRVVAFTSPAGLAAAEPARAMAEALALPIIVVVLGPSGDERAFAAELARAFTARRPSVLGC
jgi:acetolactate synthase I/II/III large subunit